MSRVEIARFSDEGDAVIAVSFLRAHGIKAVRHGLVGGYMAPGEVTVLAESAQVEKARRLLQRVLAGEFAEHDPTEDSKSGVGAALSKAILPAPDFKPPSRLAALAPLLLIVGAFIAMLLIQLVVSILGGAS